MLEEAILTLKCFIHYWSFYDEKIQTIYELSLSMPINNGLKYFNVKVVKMRMKDDITSLRQARICTKQTAKWLKLRRKVLMTKFKWNNLVYVIRPGLFNTE